MQRVQTQKTRKKAVRPVTRSIDVNLPSGGGVQVIPLTRTVLRRQGVRWEISCKNPQVAQVQVEFTDSARHHFFPKHPKHLGKEPVVNGKATLRGQGPAYQVLKKNERAKYTVRGLDQYGFPVPGAELDPVIITPKP